jgi:hypothetical protein
MSTGKCSGVGLLEDLPDTCHPLPYLSARVRGRFPLFVRDWEAVLEEPRERLPKRYGGKPPGEWLLGEFRWIYGQMDIHARRRFWPLFFFFELKTMFSTLRYRSLEGRREEAAQMLEQSLLSGEIKGALMADAPLPSVLDRLEMIMDARCSLRPGLRRAFTTEGLRGVEQALTDEFLLRLPALRLGHPLRGFFRDLVDARNIVTAFKHVMWGIRKPFTYLKGGTVGRRRLVEVIEQGDLETLESIARARAGEADAQDLWAVLFQGILRRAWRAAVTAPPAGVVFFYLLKCHAEAANFTTLLQGQGMELERLRGGLIR